jgi:hypothetical protein
MADTSDGAEYSKSKSRRGYQQIDARDPHDPTGTWQVLLSDDKAGYVARKGLGAMYEMTETMRWSLVHAEHCWRGVRHEQPEIDETEWLCYSAGPSHAWDLKRHQRVRAWDDSIFLVFVTDERVVYHWCWYDADHGDPTCPVNHLNRFTEPIF